VRLPTAPVLHPLVAVSQCFLITVLQGKCSMFLLVYLARSPLPDFFYEPCCSQSVSIVRCARVPCTSHSIPLQVNINSMFNRNTKCVNFFRCSHSTLLSLWTVKFAIVTSAQLEPRHTLGQPYFPCDTEPPPVFLVLTSANLAIGPANFVGIVTGTTSQPKSSTRSICTAASAHPPSTPQPRHQTAHFYRHSFATA
jgi:hypothetical protein